MDSVTFATQPDFSFLVTETDPSAVGRIAAAEGIALDELGLMRESLEDVFLRLTQNVTEYEGLAA